CLTITATHKVAHCEKTEQDRSPSFLDGRRAAGRHAGRYDEAHRRRNSDAHRLHQRGTGSRHPRARKQGAARCQRKTGRGCGNDGGRNPAQEALGSSRAMSRAPNAGFRLELKNPARKTCSTRTALMFIGAGMLLLSACGGHKTARSQPVAPPPTITAAEPEPHTTAERNATTVPQSAKPAAKPIYVETGLASWYGPPYNHHRGSNGEIYDQNALTAAHRTLPLNSVVRVTNEATGHAVIVRITDRGPFIEDR